MNKTIVMLQIGNIPLTGGINILGAHVDSPRLDINQNPMYENEEDFISAELEVVPAGRAREAGLDRSMILAYGQNDRVCAYASLQAILDVKNTDRTLHFRR